MMDATSNLYDDQAKLWNGTAGRAWVDQQELLDQIFKPLQDLLLRAVRAGPGGQVLDVGCGTGSTTLGTARLLGAEGRAFGIDISQPMITAARARSEREGTPASFICADAETHAFEPECFDTIVSRLGVMFFRDPVAAFSNLRRAAKSSAALRLIAWRSAAENPFMTTAERAAAHLLPNIPTRRPGAPGQFAFADHRQVRQILEKSGWSDIHVRPIDTPCTLPEIELMAYITRLGPVGLALQDADRDIRDRVIRTIRAAFAPYVYDDEVRFTAACWMVGATAS